MKLQQATVFALAMCLISAPALAGDVTVRVGHNRIEPSEVVVTMGDTVTFLNEDAMPGGHTIAADDGSASSPPLAKDESWTRKFTEPGKFGFHIVQHPGARATVVVE